MSGWWTWKLKPCGDGMDGDAAMLLYLLKGSLSGAVAHIHHQAGRSAQIMLAPGAPSLEARLGAGKKPCRIAVPRSELNWLLSNSNRAKPHTQDPASV